MKFRKRPVVIDADQLLPPHLPDGVELHIEGYQVYDRLHNTWINLDVGDWVITGVQGEKYPIKPDVLAATYEPVEG